jgi:hypothetical protein
MITYYIESTTENTKVRGTIFTMNPSAVVWKDSIWVFFKGPQGNLLENQICVNIHGKNTEWSGLNKANWIYWTRGSPAAIVYEDQLWVFYAGPDPSPNQPGYGPLLYAKYLEADYGAIGGLARNETQFSSETVPHGFTLRETSPSVVVYQEKIYVFANHSTFMFYKVYKGKDGWEQGTKTVPKADPLLKNTITAVVFKNKLFCFYRSRSDSSLTPLHYVSFDGTSWSDPLPVPGAFHYNYPSAVNYQDKTLWLFQRSWKDKLWYKTFDGTTWSAATEFDYGLSSSPTAVVFRKNVFSFHGKPESNEGKDEYEQWGTGNSLWYKRFPAE